MAVGKESLLEVHPVSGIRLASVQAGIRYADRYDLVLVELAEGSISAGVFTRNAFCAAPVIVARQNLAVMAPRYLLINTGNANAGTGKQGMTDALGCCAQLAELQKIDAQAVLPFSTGVIGESLPVDKLIAALPEAVAALAPDQWLAAARGIMTTDTHPKLASKKVQLGETTVTITGMAKGAGMLKPNMATMLAYVFTDAQFAKPALRQALSTAVELSFNRLTVDGDTSTNDACILVATGQSGVEPETDEACLKAFQHALNDLMIELATGLIRDAEGATKFVTIAVQGGESVAECLQVAYCVAESPLVKTALFASDPNWGRILAAVGRAGLENLDLDAITISLGDVPLVADGGRDPRYSEAAGQSEMDREEITITINLGRGDHAETVWTSDLSHEYVRINAEYRS